MKKRIASATTFAGILGMLTLLLSACATSSVPKAAATRVELRLGIVVPLTGAVPSFGVEVRNGVLLAVQEWNDRGGIDGRKIITFVEDGRCVARTGLEAARKLISSDHVNYLIGEVCSAASIPISEIADAARVIQITSTSTNPKVTVDSSGHVKRYVFRSCFTDPYQGIIGAKFAYNNLKARTAFVMGDVTSEYVSSLRSTFEAAFMSLGGTIVGRGDLAGDEADFSGILSGLKAVAPDVIYLPDYYNIVNLVTRQAKALDISVPFIGADGWDSSGLDLAATEGNYFDNHFSDQDPSPKVAQFMDAYDRAFPNDERAPGVRHMLSAISYDAANLLFEAIKAAGSDDTTLVSKKLESMHFSGVTGDFTFDSFHNPLKTAYINIILNHQVRLAAKVEP